MTDLNSDSQIEPKNGVFIKFPRHFKVAKLFGLKWGSHRVWSLSMLQESTTNRLPTSLLVRPFHSSSDSKSESSSSSCSLLATSFVPLWSRLLWSVSDMMLRVPSIPFSDTVGVGDGGCWFFKPDMFLFFFGGRPLGGILLIFFWGICSIESPDSLGTDVEYWKLSKNAFSEIFAIFFARWPNFFELFPKNFEFRNFARANELLRFYSLYFKHFQTI